ncbi:hypothetical protein HYDPIDRAFT_28327 [Hydnomerulius pinastri MD-312]|uniref:Helicase C-terminal domain-containing protein n=1 Tax=Hydnomerulius pinastri MD-312 TaxID=994086 RepID=A0A0C9WG85_9AGAM|nr:hypothetical protein HYDPIDRAFT_28327 [Hydnomerulius pinastri MD-312]
MPSSIMKMHNAVFFLLLVRSASVFKDPDHALSIFGLTEDMFRAPNKFLDASERRSINGISSAILTETQFPARRDILEGSNASGWGAAHNAIKKWAAKEKVNRTVHQIVEEVLSTNEATPKMMIRAMRLSEFPDITDAHEHREDIALAVFGTHILEDRFRGDLIKVIDCILHHEWERQRKRWRRAKKSMTEKRGKANKAVSDLEHAKQVTAAMLRAATKAVATYSDAIEWFPNEEESDSGVNELQEILKTITVSVVARVKRIPAHSLLPEAEQTAARTRGRRRGTRVTGVHITDAADIEQIWALYMQLFQLQPSDMDPICIGDEDDPAGHAQWHEAAANIGVELFSNMDEATIHILLNFPGGRPTLFNEFRSLSDKSVWDESDGCATAFNASNSDMTSLSLLWHQCAGIAALAGKVFTDQPGGPHPGRVPGVLIADEVGVGKTALVMGFIAFLIDVWYCSKALKGPNAATFRLAPILDIFPHFAGVDEVPDLPHVIFVPNSLLSQWVAELKRFFRRRTIEVYIYPTAQKEFGRFWEGGWATSAAPLINRIILVPHSVLTTSGRVFRLSKGARGGNAGKAVDESRDIRSPERAAECIWASRDFLTCVVDEAHEFRNIGGAFYALLEVTKASRIPLLLTATPLYTGPKDLHSLGRLARIPAFCGKEGDQSESEAWSRLRNARRNVTAEDRDASADYRLQRMTGEHAEAPDVPSIETVHEILAEWIQMIKNGFNGRVLRRTVESPRWDGKKINDSLPESRMITCPVSFDTRTAEMISEIMSRIMKVKELEVIDDASNFNKKFYLEGRTKVAFPWYTSPEYPPVKSMAEYASKPSPKMDMLVGILYHHLSSDEAAEIAFDREGNMGIKCSETGQDLKLWHTDGVKSPWQATPEGEVKILVYHEFPMMANLMLSASEASPCIFQLYNIRALTLNGTQTADERSAIVTRFNVDPTVRVLLFSSVGAVGLNLTVASIVILFDQCWSRMLVHQIIGRAWRLGQTRSVIVYNLVALDTVDMLMVDYGATKGDMLDEFLHGGGKKLTEVLRRAGEGRLNEGEDVEEEAHVVDFGRPKPRKSRRQLGTSEAHSPPSAEMDDTAHPSEQMVCSGGDGISGLETSLSPARENLEAGPHLSAFLTNAAPSLLEDPSEQPEATLHPSLSVSAAEGGISSGSAVGIPSAVDTSEPLSEEKLDTMESNSSSSDNEDITKHTDLASLGVGLPCGHDEVTLESDAPSGDMEHAGDSSLHALGREVAVTDDVSAEETIEAIPSSDIESGPEDLDSYHMSPAADMPIDEDDGIPDPGSRDDISESSEAAAAAHSDIESTVDGPATPTRSAQNKRSQSALSPSVSPPSIRSPPRKKVYVPRPERVAWEGLDDGDQAPEGSQGARALGEMNSTVPANAPRGRNGIRGAASRGWRGGKQRGVLFR